MKYQSITTKELSEKRRVRIIADFVVSSHAANMLERHFYGNSEAAVSAVVKEFFQKKVLPMHKDIRELIYQKQKTDYADPTEAKRATAVEMLKLVVCVFDFIRLTSVFQF